VKKRRIGGEKKTVFSEQISRTCIEATLPRRAGGGRVTCFV
jgi:hypothetical protein